MEFLLIDVYYNKATLSKVFLVNAFHREAKGKDRLGGNLNPLSG
jgi:hypothetical protein